MKIFKSKNFIPVLEGFCYCFMPENNPPRKKGGDKEEDKRAWWQPAVLMFAKMSGWIIFPVIAGIFLGKWVDTKLNAEPWGFLGVIGVAFFISIYGVVRTAQKEYKKIDKNNNQDQKDQE